MVVVTIGSTFAATADELRAGVQSWVASTAHAGNTAKAVFVVNCSDGANLVWGYEWDGSSISVMDAMDEIIAADTALSATKCSNDTYYSSLTYGEHTATLSYGLGTKVNDGLKFSSQSNTPVVDNDIVVLSYDDFSVPAISALSNLTYVVVTGGGSTTDGPAANAHAVTFVNAHWGFEASEANRPNYTTNTAFAIPSSWVAGTATATSYRPYIYPNGNQSDKADQGHTGRYCLYMNQPNSASRLPIFAMLPTISDKEMNSLSLEFWARTFNSTLDVNTSNTVYGDWKFGYLTSLDDTLKANFNTNVHYVQALDLTANWTKYTLDLKDFPAGSYPVIYIDSMGEHNVRYAYLDDVQFIETPAPGPEPLIGKTTTLANAVWDFSQEMATADNGYGYQIPANMIADNTTEEADSYVARILPGNETTIYGYTSTKALQVRAGRYYPTSYVILPKVTDVENYDSLQLSFYARCGYQQGEQHKYGQDSYGHSIKVGHLADVCAAADFSANIVCDTTFNLPTTTNENQGVDWDATKLWRHFSVPMKDCGDYMVLYLDNIGNAYIYLDSIAIEKIPAEEPVVTKKTITYNLVGCTAGQDEEGKENATEIEAEDENFYFYFNLAEGHSWDGVQISVMMGETALEDAMQTWNFDEGYLWDTDGDEGFLNVWVSDAFTDDLIISITCPAALNFPTEFTPATFEDITVGSNGVFYDPTLVAGNNAWLNGSFKFYTYYAEPYSPGAAPYYSDIVVSSNVDSTVAADYNNPVSYLYAPTATPNGNNFAVWNQNFYGIKDVYLDEARTLTGMYVNNTSAVLNYLTDTYTTFPTDGYYMLTVTGYNNGVLTETVNCYLIDWRDAANKKTLTNWEWLDLSSLGDVDELNFNVYSDDAGQWGLNIPAYFCFDNLGGEAPTPTAIHNTSAIKAEKIIRNGQVFIIRGEHIYNAAGQVVR